MEGASNSLSNCGNDSKSNPEDGHVVPELFGASFDSDLNVDKNNEFMAIHEVENSEAAQANQFSRTMNRKTNHPQVVHAITLDMVMQSKEKMTLHLSKFKNVFKPFISKKAYENLSQVDMKFPSESPMRILKTPELLEQPPTLHKHCKMRDYQLKGLQWLVSQHEKKIGSILADEMGLGKTLQTISFIAYLLHVKKESGPFWLWYLCLSSSIGHRRSPSGVLLSRLFGCIRMMITKCQECRRF